MISRVAENCFWMSRYLERAEDTARVLDVNHALLLDLDVPLEQQWRPVLIISGIHDFAQEAAAEVVQNYMTWDEDNPCSIAASLAAARENARIIREVISAEMWERLNYYHLWIQGPVARELYQKNRSEFYGQVRRINPLVHGIAEGTMAHGEAWEFFQFGMYLERACQTARILDVKYHTLLPTSEDVGTPIDNAQWVAILMSCSGYEPYTKRQRNSIDPGSAVADFLILDRQFPRSVRHCLAECLRAARGIAAREPGENEGEVEAHLCSALEWLDNNDIRSLIRAGLHESLTSVVTRVHAIGDVVRRTYFEARVEARPPVERLQTATANGMAQSQKQS